MNTRDDKLWSAYLDGELSTAEARDFDHALTPEERERLEAEVRFEAALAEKLADDGACPDTVWKRTVLLAQNASSGAGRKRPYRWYGGLAALAAGVALCVALFLTGGFRASTSQTLLARLDVRSDVPISLNDVQRYLVEHGVDLKVQPILESDFAPHHDVLLRGAAEVRLEDGEPVTELLYECCGKKIGVFLAKRGTDAARALEKLNADGQVKASRIVGDYRAAVVSQHSGAERFLDLITQT